MYPANLVLSECDINHMITDAEDNWQDFYQSEGLKEAQLPVPFPYVMTYLIVGASFMRRSATIMPCLTSCHLGCHIMGATTMTVSLLSISVT